MGIIDSLKNLLGLGETFDTNRDGKFDIHDLKSTGSGFTYTNDNDKADLSDIQDPPTAAPEPDDTTKSNTSSPKE